MKWIYEGVEFDENFIGDNYGFTYLVTNKITGMKYIGCKVFHFKTCKPPLKGSKRKRRGTKESDWKTYCTSNQQIMDDCKSGNENNYEWKIIEINKTLWDHRYSETYHIISSGALYDKNYLNDFLSCKIPGNKKHLIKNDKYKSQNT